MKITHNKVGQNINTTDAKSEKTSGAAQTSSVKNTSGSSDSKDVNASQANGQAAKVELSQRVQDIKKIKEIASKTPDVDADKVAKFKQMIAEGSYKVDAKAIADKMVDEHMQSRATEE